MMDLMLYNLIYHFYIFESFLYELLIVDNKHEITSCNSEFFFVLRCAFMILIELQSIFAQAFLFFIHL